MVSLDFGIPRKELAGSYKVGSARSAKLSYEICDESTDRSGWNPRINDFYEYWRGLNSGGGLPGRQHIDPVTIPRLLPTIWLLDVHRAPIRFSVRLIGTRLVTVLGRDLTGKWLDETHRSAPDLDAVLVRFRRSVIDRVVTHQPPLAATFHEKEHVIIENIVVPLARDGHTVDMLAGFSSLKSTAGRDL